MLQPPNLTGNCRGHQGCIYQFCRIRVASFRRHHRCDRCDRCYQVCRIPKVGLGSQDCLLVVTQFIKLQATGSLLFCSTGGCLLSWWEEQGCSRQTSYSMQKTQSSVWLPNHGPLLDAFAPERWQRYASIQILQTKWIPKGKKHEVETVLEEDGFGHSFLYCFITLLFTVRSFSIVKSKGHKLELESRKVLQKKVGVFLQGHF